MISALDAIERLREGNRRFVAQESTVDLSVGHEKRAELAEGQKPFAVVLACSDSRVPVEMIFDQGLGDLFVIRVAGNIAAASQIGSVEYAATELGAKLVVVLGHSNCGAVGATLQALREEQELGSPNLHAIVDRIKPAVDSLGGPSADLHDAVIANVHQSVGALQHDSLILEELVASGELAIVGAEYSIESGRVLFLDD